MTHAHNNPFINTMDLNIYRAGLTFIAFALTLIVTGCSDQNALNKTHEAHSSSNSIEESTEETAQPDEEREPRDSNSSPSYDALATAIPEKKYSGGSKAPGGEYRPADEHGPAQNVPVPKIPEGMDVESAEGLLKFVEYWNSARNYAVETGDTSFVRQRTAITHEQAIKNFDSWDKLYLNGGWVIEGKEKNIVHIENLVSLGDGYYIAPLQEVSADAIVAKNGKFQGHKLSSINHLSYEAKFQFSDSGKWFLISVNRVES